MDVIKKIEDVVEGAIEHKGYHIVRIQLSGAQRPVLQIMIERQDNTPVVIEDCVLINRYVSVLLDQYQPLKGDYTLEVSSPGMDRPLVKPKDFIRFVGHLIHLKTTLAIGGRKKFFGLLESATETSITLVWDGAKEEGKISQEIQFDNIQSAKLHVDFGS